MTRGHGLTLCWRTSWAKASVTVTPLGAASPVEGVVFPSTVFHGRKLGPSQMSDGGVPDVIPFLKASLLKFVSATTSPSGYALRFLALGMHVEGGTCSVKLELLLQGMWLDNDDMR